MAGISCSEHNSRILCEHSVYVLAVIALVHVARLQSPSQSMHWICHSSQGRASRGELVGGGQEGEWELLTQNSNNNTILYYLGFSPYIKISHTGDTDSHGVCG